MIRIGTTPRWVLLVMVLATGIGCLTRNAGGPISHARDAGSHEPVSSAAPVTTWCDEKLYLQTNRIGVRVTEAPDGAAIPGAEAGVFEVWKDPEEGWQYNDEGVYTFSSDAGIAIISRGLPAASTAVGIFVSAPGFNPTYAVIDERTACVHLELTCRSASDAGPPR